MLDYIIALLSLWAIHRVHRKYKLILNLLQKISQTPLLNVSQVIEKLKQSKGTVFVIVKGLLKIKSSKYPQKNIFSAIDIKDLRDSYSISNLYSKINWKDIMQKSFWKYPTSSKNIKFSIKDLNNNCKIQVNNCLNTQMSGALNQVIRHQHYYQHNWKPLAIIKTISNLLLSIFPLNIIFKKFKFGQQINFYSILHNQFSLVIGQAKLLQNGQIIINNPNYLTKQKSYIQSNLLSKINKLKYILTIFLSILIFIGYKYIIKGWKKFKLYFNQQYIDSLQRTIQQDDKCNCIICYDRIRNIIFKPCKHYGVCYSCYQSMKTTECPICKQKINGIIKIIKK